jgi:hypothetical protein
MMGALQGIERIMYYMYLFSITDHNKKALRSPFVCVRCTDSVELRLAAAAAALAFALGDLASASRKKW